MVYGFTYFTTGILSSCAKLLLKYGAGTRHAGADCIQHRKAWSAFSQMLFTSVKAQATRWLQYVVGQRSRPLTPTVHGLGHTRGHSFLVSRITVFVYFTVYVCLCVWGAAIMCVKP